MSQKVEKVELTDEELEAMEERINEAYEYLPVLAKTNETNYSIMKALEEMAELSEKLLKKLNKKPDYQPKDKEIVEEIGDVVVRLAVLSEIFGTVAVSERVVDKLLSLKNLSEKYKKGV